MYKPFEGKVALVTAAASGIGAATATAFAEQGAQVMLADNNAEGLAKKVAELQKSGADVCSQHVDCTSDEQVRALVENTVTTFGALDIGVNVVGAVLGDAAGAEFHNETTAGWNDTIAVSLNSSYLCMKYEIAQMLKAGKGSIVNVSSMAGVTYIPDGGIAYASAKAAIIHMTKFASLTYGEQGIRVNCITPGTTLTGVLQNPDIVDDAMAERLVSGQVIKRFIKPSEQAEAIVWLCSDASAMVTGHALPVDGGWKM
jgi:NAD(P)-dependent dehydrogenase (short-subunit alcohol dehydrogenase family)